MIVEGLISLLCTVLSTLFGVLPIPDTPSWLVALEEKFTGYLAMGGGLLHWLFGDYWTLAVNVIIVCMGIRVLWLPISFLLRKIGIRS